MIIIIKIIIMTVENVKHMLLVEWMEGERRSYMLMLNKWAIRNGMERKWKPL